MVMRKDGTMKHVIWFVVILAVMLIGMLCVCAIFDLQPKHFSWILVC